MEIGAFLGQIDWAVKNGLFKSLDEALKDSSKHGITCVDVSSKHLNTYTPEKLKSELDKHNMYVSSVYFLERIEFRTEQGMKKAVALLRECIDNIEKVGAKRIMVVPQLPEGFNKEENNNFKEAIRELLNEALRYTSGKDIAVTLENFSDTEYPYSTITDIEYWLKEIPGLKYTYDIGNYPLAGVDEIEALKAFVQKTVYVHLKDLKVCSSSNILRRGIYYDSLELGGGFVRIKEALDILKNAGYDGPLIVEINRTFEIYQSTIKSIEYLRSIM
ncbi:MAG: sugar phosphate isomerase/epimerase family protein [Bacillota bacterium]|nr:sugar phosphate isomerase/epimerase family protein [Bacillota bacterium]